MMTPLTEIASVETLLGSFSDMKLNFNVEGGQKRCADLMTIEGTPINTSKRFDLNPTPTSSGFPGNSEQSEYSYAADRLTEHAATSPVRSRPMFVDNITYSDIATTTQSKDTILQAAFFPSHSSKRPPDDSRETPSRLRVSRPILVVVTPESDQHDTGDHQENALRTALLGGPEGCLRRPHLVDSIVWAPVVAIQPAPLTDLLRYSTRRLVYNIRYIFVLRCGQEYASSVA
jgi:hypothetical protein